jgi:hypothetical protein
MLGFGDGKIRNEAKKIIESQFRTIDGHPYVVSALFEPAFRGTTR